MFSSREMQSELQWGIANDYNQLLLPYPAIGCAAVNWNMSPTLEHKPQVACCLRGGSTYVVPFLPPTGNNETGETTPVTVFTLDTETHSRYIHGFTAGNLRLPFPDGEEGKPKTLPILAYGWAGGIVDLFCCDLKGTTPCRPMIGTREILALGELVDNGSTTMLSKLLSSMDDTDPLLSQPIWRKAFEEFKRQSLDGIAAKDLLLPKFSATQELLLLLSTDGLEV